ncbi:MAG TPA: 2-dehydropantoate 2-reductase [Rectinemataceae bacterium]
MKVCVVGVGAIGGMIGFGLGAAGCELSGLARGPTLRALRERGLRFTDGGPESSVPIHASESPEELGIQDLVVLAVKAPALPSAAARISPLLGSETIVMPAMNGIPWWFFQGFGGSLEGKRLSSIDPGGEIESAIPASSILGCVVHMGASCPEPGLVRALKLRTLIIGEPSGEMSPRLAETAELLGRAGFEAKASSCIQKDIWYKLWGNMTMNPLSALTGATMDLILGDPLVEEFCKRIMVEARDLGARIGCEISQSVEDRLAISRTLGAFKTSMLQDLEAGKPLELDALVGAVAEIGDLAGMDTPYIDTLLGLARLKARILGLYPAENA